jgi:hypothetical protein
VVEFQEITIGGKLQLYAYEIMDKSYHRGIFLYGENADRFRDSVMTLMQENRSLDEVDEFLSGYTEAMTQSLTFH